MCGPVPEADRDRPLLLPPPRLLSGGPTGVVGGLRVRRWPGGRHLASGPDQHGRAGPGRTPVGEGPARAAPGVTRPAAPAIGPGARSRTADGRPIATPVRDW